MRIAIVGDNASLKMGGEAQKPYRFFTGFSMLGHSCRLVVHARCRHELRTLLAPERFAEVAFVEDSRFDRVLHGLSRLLPQRLAEISTMRLIGLSFQIRARRILSTLHRELRFDVVHQPTPISPSAPSLIYNIGCPVVCGPMSANPGSPPAFRGGLDRLTEGSAATLWKIALAVQRVVPGKRKAKALVGSNNRTAEILHSIAGPDTAVHISLENAVEDLWFDIRNRPDPNDPQIVFVGRLVDWKGVDLLIEAIGRLPRPAKLTIIGDGPERARLQALAERSAPGQIEFAGWLDHDAIAALYARATAVASLSWREAGGTSVQEAMAAGVPVVALAWGGHMTRMISEAGALIHPNGRESVIRQTVDILERLIAEPEYQKSCGAAGRDHAWHNFRWIEMYRRFEIYFTQAVRDRQAASGQRPDASDPELVPKQQLVPDRDR